MRPFFLGRTWINNQRKSNSVWHKTPHWKIIALICCARRSPIHLNNHICQHRGMKTSTVTPSFYYVSNISLSCNINIPSFIGNLWWDLLLGNHLNGLQRWSQPQLFQPNFWLLPQYSRQPLGFSAHKGALTSKIDLTFPVFSKRFVDFAAQFCFRCTFSNRLQRTSKCGKNLGDALGYGISHSPQLSLVFP